MKRYQFFILVLLLSLVCFPQAKGQTSSSSGSTATSSSSGSTTTSSSGSPCDVELSKTITNVSYPNGCNVGVVVTCCPLSQVGMGFITYGDSLGDDLNDLIVSWSIDCTGKKVTFTGSGQSDCLAQATTLCGNVVNKGGSQVTCNLPSTSVCCLAASSSSSGASTNPSPSPSLINDLNSIIENEKKALKDFDNDDDLADKDLKSALSGLKALRVNLFLDPIIHNAKDEVKMRMKNNLSCAIASDNKAEKIAKLEATSPKDHPKLNRLFEEELNKASKCKEKLLEDLKALIK